MTYMAKGKIRTNKPIQEQSADGNARAYLVERVALVASDAAGGVFTWTNYHDTAILVHRVVVDVTTAATAACTLDIGVSTTVASADNLLDGLDVNAATGTFDNITDKGTNGKSRQRLASGKYITASKASGAAAGLAGYAYIFYTRA